MHQLALSHGKKQGERESEGCDAGEHNIEPHPFHPELLGLENHEGGARNCHDQDVEGEYPVDGGPKPGIQVVLSCDAGNAVEYPGSDQAHEGHNEEEHKSRVMINRCHVHRVGPGSQAWAEGSGLAWRNHE